MKQIIIAVCATALITALCADASQVTLDFHSAPVEQVLREAAQQTGVNILWRDRLDGLVSIKLKDADLDLALRLICLPHQYQFRKVGEAYFVWSPAATAEKTASGTKSAGEGRPPGEQGAELLPNGGFEQEQEGWSAVRSPQGVYAFQWNDVHQGRTALQLSGTAVTAPVGVQTKSPIPVEELREYTLELWCRGLSASPRPPIATAVVEFLDVSGQAIPGSRLIQALPTNAQKWTKVVRAFRPPAGADKATVAILSRQAQSGLLVDDISLKPGAPAEPNQEMELLHAGGVEQGEGELPDGWSVELPDGALGSPANAANLLGARFTWTNIAALNGHRALEVQNVDRSVKAPLNWVQVVPWTIEPGAHFLLRAWGRHLGDNEARISVHLIQPKAPGDVELVERLVGSLALDSAMWQAHRATLDPSVVAIEKGWPRDLPIPGALVVRAGMQGIGKAWFDDLHLTALPPPEAPQIAKKPKPTRAATARARRRAAGVGAHLPYGSRAAREARAAAEAASRRGTSLIRAQREAGGVRRQPIGRGMRSAP